MQRKRLIHRIKATLLLTVATTGGTMFAGCNLVNLRDAVVNGTQGFATGYVAAAWNAIVPPAGSLIDGGDDDA